MRTTLRVDDELLVDDADVLAVLLLEGFGDDRLVAGDRRMAEHVELALAELGKLTPSPSVQVLSGIASWTTYELG